MEKIRFKGVKGYDVYNPSLPFSNLDYIFGRVEKRKDWAQSSTKLFQKTAENEYTLVKTAAHFLLEDPFVVKIDNQLILGGVRVFHKENKIDRFYTYFYKGENINNLKYFARGPKNMKDIRLVELEDKRIGVFSRPKSSEIKKQYGSEAIVGFIIIDNLDELTSENIEKAENIPGIFKENEWGGCNQAINLGNYKIGVIGHKAYLENNQYIYEVISFIYDIEKNKISNYKTIASRNMFATGPSKKESLSQVCFPAGIVKNDEKSVILYSGLNDCEVGKIIINNPFL